MDDRQLIVELAKALAWPVVVLVFLFLIRKHLGALMGRLAKVTFPGGGGAEFNKGMTEATQTQIEAEATDKQLLLPASAPQLSAHDQAVMATVTTGIDHFFALAMASPRESIVETYSVLESVLQTFEKKIPVDSRKSLYDAVKNLVDNGHLDEKWLNLLVRVRHLRNLAAHGSIQQLSYDDALNYQNLCRSLSDKLFEVFGKQPDQN